MHYTEIFKLKQMLLDSEIPFELKKLYDGFQICYPRANKNVCDDGRVCSVIEHNGSYGHEQDLLEIMGLLTKEEAEYDEVVGYLTAEDVFERIKKHYEEVQ